MLSRILSKKPTAVLKRSSVIHARLYAHHSYKLEKLNTKIAEALKLMNLKVPEQIHGIYEVYEDKGKFELTIQERGVIIETKKADSVEKAAFYIIHDISRDHSHKFWHQNFLLNLFQLDSRRQWMRYHLALLYKADPVWADTAKNDYCKVLERHPFTDWFPKEWWQHSATYEKRWMRVIYASILVSDAFAIAFLLFGYMNGYI
eukprot:TRINITY_DN3716_c0_g1_i1.p1 TRINITY_DN3716_c0_g1~~TRINITY_DN3716_c0_g1_i1.p1  ORF type:complete len:203 (+),score=21.59 TRINITY_DN3716_c0_g1_i1:36-644(+)